MGNIADYYKSDKFLGKYDDLLELYLLGKLPWIAGTGKEIPIQKLNFIHLDNCIKMLSSDKSNPMLRILKYEKEKRNNLLDYSERY